MRGTKEQEPEVPAEVASSASGSKDAGLLSVMVEMVMEEVVSGSELEVESLSEDGMEGVGAEWERSVKL